MAISLTRAARGPSAAPGPRRTAAPWPGLALVAGGVTAAWGVHRLLPAVPLLTAAIVLGLLVAHLPHAGGFARGRGRPGLSLAGRRFMRLGVVLLGLELSLTEVLDLGWATAAMVLGVVVATFFGTIWLGRRVGLTGDQPLLVATGYSICGASAIGAVSEVRRSDERDVAASVALVTLCGTLAIAVLPLLHQPLGLGDAEFGRWVGAGVHDVGQVVATAQTAGQEALGEAVLVKLMRVVLLAPLVAVLAAAVARRRLTAAAPPGGATDGGAESGDPAGGGPATKRPPLVPLFVAGFLASAALRTTGVLPDGLLEGAATLREALLAAALFGLGSGVFLPSLARTGWRMAAVGSGSWVVIAGLSYAGVLLTA
ncbi:MULTISPECIES: YeiH family protein [unclassified Streptomyces]|uniref:YeiH family protein n=1 Tax=unclassified Streptomyces TaxID=2593676 RepID=UPI0022B6DE35|nr:MULTISPECIES: putative sulfate exporter family transporter [unclassified Streptomyces]MCZ7413913.1 putative sulfate exporter family transporter [Streptomyces sp. WMMC897]MCZ7430909.1 putative sulfate exporter family transporter [Streptomyces sp. WMMC1477]